MKRGRELFTVAKEASVLRLFESFFLSSHINHISNNNITTTTTTVPESPDTLSLLHSECSVSAQLKVTFSVSRWS